MSEIKAWMHQHRGKIVGKIVSEYGEFVDIRLTQDQTHRYSNGNDYKDYGALITVRKSFLTEIDVSHETSEVKE